MESVRYVLLIALCGAVGAVSRHGIGLGVQRLAGDAFPLGTFTVNMLGCFLLGLLAGLAVARPESSHALSPAMRDALAVGFLGALTTFSTFSLDTMKLLQRQAYGLACLNVGASVLLGLAAVALGLWLARLLAGAASS